MPPRSDAAKVNPTPRWLSFARQALNVHSSLALSHSSDACAVVIQALPFRHFALPFACDYGTIQYTYMDALRRTYSAPLPAPLVVPFVPTPLLPPPNVNRSLVPPIGAADPLGVSTLDAAAVDSPSIARSPIWLKLPFSLVTLAIISWQCFCPNVSSCSANPQPSQHLPQ